MVTYFLGLYTYVIWADLVSQCYFVSRSLEERRWWNLDLWDMEEDGIEVVKESIYPGAKG